MIWEAYTPKPSGRKQPKLKTVKCSRDNCNVIALSYYKQTKRIKKLLSERPLCFGCSRFFHTVY